MAEHSKEANMIVCEACDREIPEDQPHHVCADGPDLCGSCAPTYDDMVRTPAQFESANGSPMSQSEADQIAAWHVACGGSLSDPLV